jgi:hypothetical protein
MGKMDQLYMDTQAHLSGLLKRPPTEREINDYVAYNTLLLSNAPVSAAPAIGPTYPLWTVSRDCAPSGTPANESADWRPPVGTIAYCKDEGRACEIEHHCKDGDVLVYGTNYDNESWSCTYDQDDFNDNFSLTPVTLVPIGGVGEPINSNASLNWVYADLPQMTRRSSVTFSTFQNLSKVDLSDLQNQINELNAHIIKTHGVPQYELERRFSEEASNVKLDPLCCGEPAELKTFSTFSYHYCNLCKQEVK